MNPLSQRRGGGQPPRALSDFSRKPRRSLGHHGLSKPGPSNNQLRRNSIDADWKTPGADPRRHDYRVFFLCVCRKTGSLARLHRTVAHRSSSRTSTKSGLQGRPRTSRAASRTFNGDHEQVAGAHFEEYRHRLHLHWRGRVALLLERGLPLPYERTTPMRPGRFDEAGISPLNRKALPQSKRSAPSTPGRSPGC